MKKIMILSGAGLSAESGIRTFRDHNGLWENHDVMKVCSIQGWIADRQLALILTLMNTLSISFRKKRVS